MEGERIVGVLCGREPVFEGQAESFGKSDPGSDVGYVKRKDQGVCDISGRVLSLRPHLLTFMIGSRNDDLIA